MNVCIGYYRQFHYIVSVSVCVCVCVSHSDLSEVGEPCLLESKEATLPDIVHLLLLVEEPLLETWCVYMCVHV